MAAPQPSPRQPCHQRDVRLSLPTGSRFFTPLGWGLLAASLLAHALLLALLPMPHRHAMHQQRDILLSLKDPPPPPPREPKPEPPKPEPQQQPTPEPEPVKPPPPEEPAPQPSEPGPVIGVPGDGPGAVHSGTELPPAKEDPPAPPPAVEPLPLEPEPEPQVDVKALLLEYAAGVKSSILAHKYYPSAAERLGHSGNVKVGFTIDASGSLASVAIKSSSGYDELDGAAMDAVRRAAPFNSIPIETGRSELSLSITMKYSIN